MTRLDDRQAKQEEPAENLRWYQEIATPRCGSQ